MKFATIMENEIRRKEIEKWNFWLVFESNSEVVHLSGFMVEPSKHDIDHILEELKTDEEFKLEDEVLNTLSYRLVNKQEGLKLIENF
jgi:hypothetical protein